MLPSHNRFQYSGIQSRPQFNWPDNKRLALYIAVNIEHFPYGVQCGVDLDRQTQPWSQRSWLWREYGNCIGEWRLIELFDSGQIQGAEWYAAWKAAKKKSDMADALCMTVDLVDG